jgi:anti-sigma regulatory factor (Ser/Thr protein kinase)
MLKTRGRGLYLIHAFMDEVRHNEVGNEIHMTKHAGKVCG